VKTSRHLKAVGEGEAVAAEPRSQTAQQLVATLVNRAKAGDTQAWARLYQELFDGLYRHLGYLTHDAIVAEDLVQETFARAFASLDRFDQRSSFTTWLHGIGINVVRRWWRSNTRRDRAYRGLERHNRVNAEIRNPDPELSEVRKQRAAALLTTVEMLPPKLREAYVLLELRQLSREEAAAQLGITVGNLSVRATRARCKLRDELVRLGWIAKEEES
jgi:RNA polymerase sigma-70 factor (ECF subfamily)